MKIKKGDIFDMYEEGEPTRRCLALEESVDDVVTCGYVDDGILYHIVVDIENEIEKVLCNINDLEEIVEKAWMYDDLNK